MRLAGYIHDGHTSCGVVTEEGIIDIPSHLQDDACRSIKDILTGGARCIEAVAEITDCPKEYLRPDKVRFLAPVSGSAKLIGLAGNYTKHIIEHGCKLGLADLPRYNTVPRPFIMPPTALAGHDATIAWPVYSEQIDYEVELAVIIGRTARCVSPEKALEYVAGYSIANDISARSVTFASGRSARPWDEFFDWLGGKWADGFLPVGPWLVMADEIPQPGGLRIELEVNGQARQRANTSEMIFPVEDIVSFLSHIMTLEPGDCIATGTPEGVGLATGRFLQAGDRIEARIEKIGTLRNIMGPRPKTFYRPIERSGRLG